MKTLVGWASWMVVLGLAMTACSDDGGDNAPCGSDNDCKGSRICLSSGKCSDESGGGEGSPVGNWLYSTHDGTPYSGLDEELKWAFFCSNGTWRIAKRKCSAWEHNATLSQTWNSDGTIELRQGNWNLPGTWAVDGNTLTINYGVSSDGDPPAVIVLTRTSACQGSFCP